MRRGLLKDSSVTMLLQLLRTFGGLALLPPLISSLGSDRYGVVALGISICTYASLLESVLTPVLRNELNVAVANGDVTAVGRLATVARTSALVLLVLASMIAAMLMATSYQLPEVSWPMVAAVCTAAIALGAMGSISDCLHSAGDRLWQIRGFELFATAGGFTLAFLTRDLLSPVVTLLCMCLLPQLGRVVAWAFLRLPESPEGARFHLSTTGRFFRTHGRDSISFTKLQLLQCALGTFPVIFLSWRLSLTDTTIYTLVARVMTAPANFIVALMPIAWPRITRSVSQGQAAGVARALPVGSGLILGSLLLWFGVVWLLDEQIFGLLSHGTLVVPPISLILGLSAFVAANTVVAWISTVLNAVGAFADQVRPTGTSLIVLLVMAPPLLTAFGASGLAWSAFVAVALCIGLPTYWRARVLLRERRGADTGTP
ncbi:lipopolysaccharide biosynthesis protein [Roseateles sp. 22389]|uniref:lipopolysaccharide biosynthesis protein n=1 Tax=Roseateles sp. 22389 TaxID=3453916 RepID=UPI003F87649F